MTAETWASVQSLVSSAIDQCHASTPYSDGELISIGTKLATFVASSPLLSLDVETAFAAPTIEQFFHTGLPTWSPASRGNARSMLYRMSETLLGTTTRGDRLFALPASSPSRPYDAAELKQIDKWIRAQQGERRRDATVLVALGLGAGLSTSEITGLRVDDLTVVELDGVVVIASVEVSCARSRVVTIESRWGEQLAAAVSGRGGQGFAFEPKREAAGKNLVSNFVARSEGEGVRPNAQRMRATWVVGHLESGTPIVSLMELAGVRSLDALSRYVRFVGVAA